MEIDAEFTLKKVVIHKSPEPMDIALPFCRVKDISKT
jgi:hypothetical protein